MMLKTQKKLKKYSFIFYLLTINIISLSSAGRVKKLHGPHMAPRAVVCPRVEHVLDFRLAGNSAIVIVGLCVRQASASWPSAWVDDGWDKMGGKKKHDNTEKEMKK